MRNMVTNLVRVEQMRTTVAKAKEVRRHADRVITMAKKGKTLGWSRAAAFLTNKDMVHKLFDVLLPRFAERHGGYTRILRAGIRPSDKAPMAIIEYLQPNYVSVNKGARKNPIVPPSWASNVGTSSLASSTPTTPASSVTLPKSEHQ